MNVYFKKNTCEEECSSEITLQLLLKYFVNACVIPKSFSQVIFCFANIDIVS